MCGIVGYVGTKDTTPLLIEGLRRLEYRGYDSAGVAVLNGAGVETRRAAGKIARLEQALLAEPAHGTVGIGHTRWATHGPPVERNAHPHTDEQRTIAVVHNGIIENSTALKQSLESRGHVFTSDTDTEVLAHLIEELFDGNLEAAVVQALKRVEGTYGIAVISSLDKDKIVAARKGSPLLIGIGQGEWFVASDVSAILAHTRDVVYLDDGDVAVLTRTGYRIIDHQESTVEKTVSRIDWDLDQIERGGFA
ncbi:MAG: glutamine--fructose-6-phosphate aminotransferase, partial [Gemmatimonadaceae bacterium]|nr:glutamine--fructose-6-phosphate aminotransferase [Gemmatimonadaceae bacterium]